MQDETPQITENRGYLRSHPSFGEPQAATGNGQEAARSRAFGRRGCGAPRGRPPRRDPRHPLENVRERLCLDDPKAAEAQGDVTARR